MKSSRDQFDEWFKAKKVAMQKKGIASLSIRRMHASQWSAWQASRAAIEIELPGSFRESYQSSNMVIDEQETIERIESQGLKVKS